MLSSRYANKGRGHGVEAKSFALRPSQLSEVKPLTSADVKGARRPIRTHQLQAAAKLAEAPRPLP